MSGCYCCGEALSGYGTENINGKDVNVCISCSNLKSRYVRGEMGTPNTFKVGQKIFVEYCGDWQKAVIYSIEVNKTPKGDVCNYLCYHEHKYCYDDEKEMVEDFGWFNEIKAREENDVAELVDKNNKFVRYVTEEEKTVI